MKYFQSHNNLTDSRRLDASRKRLNRLQKRQSVVESITKANKRDNELDKITTSLAIRFSHEI